jgi:hypothetical protein
MEQMTERLLAEMKVSRENKDGGRDGNTDSFVSQMDANKAKTRTNHEELMALVKVNKEKIKACQKSREAK